MNAVKTASIIIISIVVSFVTTASAAPTTEWAFHKSGNGSQPSGTEQQYVWMMNRARANPAVEGIWLSMVRESRVQFAIGYFKVSTPLLRSEFADLEATPPAAFDIRLHNAAAAHSDVLAATDKQNHDGQSTRITDAGFSRTSYRGSVYSYAKSGIHGHAGFNIDWGGSDGTGMQTGRGHRAGLMGNYSNVGVGIVEESDSSTGVGPEVTTINYCNARSSAADHYNRFIVGTVWEDRNDNRFYDIGEGVSGVTVMPDLGDFYAVTGAAGGYAIPVDGGATYALTFSGGSLEASIVKPVAVGSSSVLVPWYDFPAAGGGAEIAIAWDPLRVDAQWQSYFGQPSAVESGSGGGGWALEESGYSESGGMLGWSQTADRESPRRFWRVRGWSY